jgi:hypothetical protein
MLTNARIGANVSVSSLDGAISFYEGKVGLRLFERGEGEPYARFKGVRDTVSQLQANGVVFEEYDMPGMKTQDGVVVMGDTRAAWLKDPDGNILEIVGG